MSRHELTRQLRAIRAAHERIQPDAAWVKRTRETLRMQVSNGLPTGRADWHEKAQSFVRMFVPREFAQMLRGPIMAVLSVFGLITGGSIAGVSAAERSVPGDFLYQVKLANEQTRLLFAKDKTDRVKLKATFLARRGQEIKDILSSDVNEKPERIKRATDLLKRDLDTVKTQMSEVTQSGTTLQAAEVAMVVDQQSTELVAALKSVHDSLPTSSRSGVVEVENAAYAAGVKAVQVLITTKNDPDAQHVVTLEELVLSITQKTAGVQESVKDATAKYADPSMLPPTYTTSTREESLTQIRNAEASLTASRQLLGENQLDQASDKLLEATKAVAAAEMISAPSAASIMDQLPPTFVTTTTDGSSTDAAVSSTSSDAASSTDAGAIMLPKP